MERNTLFLLTLALFALIPALIIVFDKESATTLNESPATVAPEAVSTEPISHARPSDEKNSDDTTASSSDDDQPHTSNTKIVSPTYSIASTFNSETFPDTVWSSAPISYEKVGEMDTFGKMERVRIVHPNDLPYPVHVSETFQLNEEHSELKHPKKLSWFITRKNLNYSGKNQLTLRVATNNRFLRLKVSIE